MHLFSFPFVYSRREGKGDDISFLLFVYSRGKWKGDISFLRVDGKGIKEVAFFVCFLKGVMREKQTRKSALVFLKGWGEQREGQRHAHAGVDSSTHRMRNGHIMHARIDGALTFCDEPLMDKLDCFFWHFWWVLFCLGVWKTIFPLVDRARKRGLQLFTFVVWFLQGNRTFKYQHY